MKASIGIIWEQCSDLPIDTNVGKPMMVKGKVYCEGPLTCNKNIDGGPEQVKEVYHFVCCYDPIEDNWTTLPPLPVGYVGLGAVNGQLVAVGGMRNTGEVSNNVYTYNEQ